MTTSSQLTTVNSLITGGAGFIGSHLLDDLIPRGDVVVLDDFSTGKRERLKGRDVRVVEGDIADSAAVEDALRGADIVFHLAANPSVISSVADPLDTCRVNDLGTVTLLQAARRAGIRTCVFASSCAVYGNGQPPCVETMPVEPLSLYAASKLAGEAYMLAAARSWDLRTVSLRLFNVYGPGQDPNGEYAAVIPKFVERITDDRPITIYGDGRQTRDFVYVKDVARALVAAAVVDKTPPHPINIASGRDTSLLDLVQKLAEVTGKSIEPSFAAARAGEVQHSRADIGAAERLLGWRPHVDLEGGLRSLLVQA